MMAVETLRSYRVILQISRTPFRTSNCQCMINIERPSYALGLVYCMEPGYVDLTYRAARNYLNMDSSIPFRYFVYLYQAIEAMTEPAYSFLPILKMRGIERIQTIEKRVQAGWHPPASSDVSRLWDAWCEVLYYQCELLRQERCDLLSDVLQRRNAIELSIDETCSSWINALCKPQ